MAVFANRKQGTVDTERHRKLTREALAELEQKEKAPAQKVMDMIISILPMLCCGLALLEYILIPDRFNNPHPER